MPSIPETLTPAQYNDLYPRYIASERSQKKSEHTLKSYDLGCRKFRDYLAETNPEEITPLVVQEWVDGMMDSGISQNSSSMYYGAVERFFKWAKRMKVVSDSPMPEDGRPSIVFQKKEIPTKDEIKRLLDPANIPPSIISKFPRRNYTIVSTIILTGLRSDELRELRLSDLDFDEGIIHVRNGKGGKERNAPFPQKAREIIRDYLKAGIRPDWCTDEDYLFGTHQHELDEKTASREDLWHKFDAATLGRLVHRYGMTVIGREIHPHLLRHCAASIWDDSGADMRDVQQALGHANLATTERVYIHILDKKKAAKAINSVLTML